MMKRGAAAVAITGSALLAAVWCCGPASAVSEPPSKFVASAGSAPTGYVLNTEMYLTAASDGLTFTDTANGRVIHCTSLDTFYGTLRVGALPQEQDGPRLGGYRSDIDTYPSQPAVHGCTSPGYVQNPDPERSGIGQRLYVSSASATAHQGSDDFYTLESLVSSSGGNACAVEIDGAADYRFSDQYSVLTLTGTSNNGSKTDPFDAPLHVDDKYGCGSDFTIGDPVTVTARQKLKASNASFNPIAVTKNP